MIIKVILVDDHPIVRQGLRSIISRDKWIEVVAEASDGKEAVELSQKFLPDVVIMDITLPFLNGLDASYRILKKNKEIKILILSMHENRGFIEKSLDYGVKGYVLKESAAEEIVGAIKEVYAGRIFVSSKIRSFMEDDFVLPKRKTSSLKSLSQLTLREREILQLIAEGLSNKQIAARLNIAFKTVLAHRNNIMQKLNIHNQTNLVRFALQEGIISF
ncbi:MAG: response regulator [Candidatus Omnitrophica bacterium]|nr:response regulator [Candidatus Omnitrophota bacterium]MBD3268964.1 response regulator [Candidatus Omnitrophota bacterium]